MSLLYCFEADLASLLADLNSYTRQYKLILICVDKCPRKFSKLLDSDNCLNFDGKDEETALAMLRAYLSGEGMELIECPIYPGKVADYSFKKKPDSIKQGQIKEDSNVSLKGTTSSYNILIDTTNYLTATSDKPRQQILDEPSTGANTSLSLSDSRSQPTFSTAPIEDIEVFIAYASKDRTLRGELEVHLSPLKRRGLKIWHDQEIRAGGNWEEEIEAHMEAASLILLLVSPDFIASNYCYNKEMEYALKRHKEGKAKVIPIIIRPADWDDTPLRQLQALPTNTLPITSWSDKDDAFVNVARGIKRAITDLIAVV